MKEEILKKHIDKESMDDLSVNVWLDILEAMDEYAEEYHRQHSAKPPVMKSVCEHSWERKIYEDRDFAMQCIKCKEIR